MKLEEAKQLWIVNWIWWKGGFNFSLFFKNNISQFKEYIPEKWEKLFNDIEELSRSHDIAFFNGNTLIDKIKADYTFSLWVYRLLNWTTTLKRIFVFSVIMITLLIMWNKTFNFKKK
jgi:hypothetical protein